MFIWKKASLSCKESEVHYDVMGTNIIILTFDIFSGAPITRHPLPGSKCAMMNFP